MPAGRKNCAKWVASPLIAATLCLCLTLCMSGAISAPAFGEHSPLELLSPSGPQSVALTLTAVAKPRKSLRLRGRLFLMFENVTRRRQHVRVQYASGSSVGVRSLPEATVGPLELKQVELPLELPTGATPDDLDGTLDVHIFNGPGGKLAQEYTLPVTGHLQAIGDIRFLPASGSVQVTKGCLFSLCNATSGDSVRLVGAGVSELSRSCARPTSPRSPRG